MKLINDKLKTNTNQVNDQRRLFLLKGVKLLGGISAFCAAIPFISSWFPSVRVKAAARPVEVDLSQLKLGQLVTVEWFGKPIWILRRTPEMLNHLSTHENQLRDPDSLVKQQPFYAKNRYRSMNPEYLILIGICTHLGCLPKYIPGKKTRDSTWSGSFDCPCHGSRFDLSGRVFKGVPAPINLEVPPYRFVNERVVVIGEEA